LAVQDTETNADFYPAFSAAVTGSISTLYVDNPGLKYNPSTGTMSATGNINGGNIRTVGQVSATGNITGSYLFGNGSQLIGIGRSLTIGTRSVPVVIPLTASGNFTVGTRNSGNVVITTTT
jgi:hypothetical protein